MKRQVYIIENKPELSYNDLIASDYKLLVDETQETPIMEVNWGEIGGTFTDQTDLSNALSAKEDKTNKVSVLTPSVINYPTNQAVIDYLAANLLHKTGYATETKSGELVIDSGTDNISGLKLSRLPFKNGEEYFEIFYESVRNSGDEILCFCPGNNNEIFAGTYDGRILKFNPDKTYSVYGTNHTIQTGQANVIRVDSEGNVFCFGTNSRAVTKTTTDGLTAILGTVSTSIAVYFTEDDCIYYLSDRNRQVNKMDSVTGAVSSIGTPFADSIMSLIKGKDEDFYISIYNKAIYKMDPAGTKTLLCTPVDIQEQLTKVGNYIYAVNRAYSVRTVTKISLATNTIEYIDSSIQGNAKPHKIAYSPKRNEILITFYNSTLPGVLDIVTGVINSIGNITYTRNANAILISSTSGNVYALTAIGIDKFIEEKPVSSILKTNINGLVVRSEFLEDVEYVKKTDFKSYEPSFTKNTAFNKPFGTVGNTVVEGNDVRLLQVVNKKVNAISVTGDSNKTITITREDGTVLTASFLDKDTEYPDDVINTLTFNANNDGVLIAITSLGEVLSISLDGRYSLLGHTHNISDINGLQSKLDNVIHTTGNESKIGVLDFIDGNSSWKYSSLEYPITFVNPRNFVAMDFNSSIAFNGNNITKTVGSFTTTLGFTNPTSNRNIVFQDKSGIVAYLGDLPTTPFTGTISQFVDGTGVLQDKSQFQPSLGFTPAVDTNVLHKTGDETKNGSLAANSFGVNGNSTTAPGGYAYTVTNRGSFPAPPKLVYSVDNLGNIITIGTITASPATTDAQVPTLGQVKGITDLIKAPLASPALTGTPTAPTATAGTNTTQIATTAFVQANGGRPYKVYTALLTQTGTSAPTAVVLENTLGGAVVWTRNSTGDYSGTLTGAFTSNKTFFIYEGHLRSNSSYMRLQQINSNSVRMFSNLISGGTLVDGYINTICVEIRVYP